MGLDVVFVELPEVGSTIERDGALGTVESVKAVSDLFAPISGEVIEVNAVLEEQPELVNSDPYQAAWMLKVKPSNSADLETLLNAKDYTQLIEA